jgi:hypothetical protein
MITASSSRSDDDNNVSLGADQEEAPASTYDAASSSAVPQCRFGVPLQWDSFTYKYEAHWMDDFSM